MHGDEFYPSPLVIFQLAESCHRLADAVRHYQKHLAGKPLCEVETDPAKSAWLSLVDSLYRTGSISAGNGFLLSPDGDDEAEGWEDSIDLSEALDNGQRFMRILTHRLRNVLPCRMILTNTVVRWYAKATSSRGRNKRGQLLVWWTAPDGFDEFAEEIRQSTRGLNSISWNEALRYVTEEPNVTVDELQVLSDRIITDRQEKHDANLYQDVWTARFLLRVEQRRKLADLSALFPDEGDEWERFDVVLDESFTWPDLDDFRTGPDDKDVRDDIEALALGPRDDDGTLIADELGLWAGSGFADELNLWREADLESHLDPLYRSGWQPENSPAVATEEAGIAYAAEVAWNLREWLRECAATPSLRPVLDSLLPGIRAKLASTLVDADLASQASRLPSGELTAESLVASIGEMRFSDGARIRLPDGEPPDKWQTLARYRARIIAARLVDEQNQPLFDPDNPNDLDGIERVNGYVLQQLWQAGEQLDRGKPDETAPKMPPPANSEAPPASTSPTSGDDLSVGTCKEIAVKFNVDYERLRKRLERFRADNDGGYTEVRNRKPRAPKFIYTVASIQHIIHELRV